MKIQRPILFVLLLTLTGAIIFTWSTYQDNLRTQNTQRWINHTNDVIKNIDDIATAITATESNVRGHVITGDSAFIANYTATEDSIFRSVKNNRELVKDNPPQAVLSRKLQQYINSKLVFQQKIIQVKRNDDLMANRLISSLEGKILMDSITGTLASMKNIENSLLEERIQNNREAAENFLSTAWIGGGIIILFLIILLLRLNRDIILRRQAETKLRESEKKYRQFIENSDVVTYTADIKGNFTFISPQVTILTGYSEEELLGKHFTILVKPDWAPKVMSKYLEQFANHIKETNFTFPVQTKNKKIRWVEQNALLIIKNEKIIAFQCTVKDITERVLTEEKLKQIEEEQKAYQFRLQAILDNTPLIIYVKDLEEKYTLINKQFKETFNVEESDILGKTVYDLEGQSAEMYAIADKKVMETLKPVEMEDILQMNDGPHYLLTVKFPLFDQNKQLFGICGIMKDITEMVQYREELIAARQKAENAEMLQEQFLANMSHEIRTPMNGITGMTSLLLHTNLSKQQQEYIGVIKQSSDNLLVLINDILDLSKIKAGKIVIEQIPFILSEIIQPLAMSFRIKAAEKGIVLSVETDPLLPVQIEGDPYRLTQILNNLLSNAVKFTEKGEITLRITQQSKEKDIIDIGFTVTDSGIGIEENQLGYIFEGFVQASSDTTRKFGGTGLGLAITKKLIELQGGFITVTSDPGKGTSFFFILPFIETSKELPVAKKKTDVSDLELQTYEGKKILIVEDNKINQQVLQLSLERYKVHVTVASNGKEAIRVLEKDSTYNLILMDLRMPEMDGYQATDYIRRQLMLDIPIVILTASALRNERQKSIELGANEYVTKPFTPQDLRNCLHRYLSGLNILKEQSVTKEITQEQLYDLSMLFQLEDPENIKVVYDLFEETVFPALELLKQYTLKENWKEVYEQAHKLKSSLSIIQIAEVRNNMSNIEEKSKKDKNVEQVLKIISQSKEKLLHMMPMIKLEIEKKLE